LASTPQRDDAPTGAERGAGVHDPPDLQVQLITSRLQREQHGFDVGLRIGEYHREARTAAADGHQQR
jgi:hypothetical protein